MKNYYITFLLAIFLVSCYTEDKTVDPTVMPEETTIGANTFACLVDGWLYVGGRYFLRSQSIIFRYDEALNTIEVSVKVKDVGKDYDYLAFTINNPDAPLAKEITKCTFTNARWFDGRYTNSNIELGNGTVEITRFDKKTKIISGRLYSDGKGPITHGQFDVTYFDVQSSY
jgi:hypothetical protein